MQTLQSDNVQDKIHFEIITGINMQIILMYIKKISFFYFFNIF